MPHAMEQRRMQEGKRDWFGLLANLRHFSKHEDVLSLPSTPSPESKRERPALRPHIDYTEEEEEKLDDIVEHRKWTTIQASGTRPSARSNHAATIIGRKMVVVGGESDNRKLNDVHVLHLGKLAWSELGLSPNDTPTSKPTQQLPSCSGHSLISWGKTVLLIGGDMTPRMEKVTVWSFDLETEQWIKVNAKGEIPAARSGQSVTRAGSILIMFGGEDVKGRKLNDLHVLDLKSLMWLPLHTLGKAPSPRTRHLAAMYDDRYLLVFGGASKSKVLNDLYALDFETMMWSRLRPGGLSPSARAGSSGVLVNDRWYICGGAHRGIRFRETIMLDISKMAWINVLSTSLDAVATNEDSSLVMVQKKDRSFLVAFGGCGVKSKSDQVQVLYISSSEQKGSSGHASEPFYDNLYSSPKDPLVPCAGLNVAKALVSPSDQRSSVLGRLLESPSPEAVPGLVPLRKIHSHSHSIQKSPEKKSGALKKDSHLHISGRNGEDGRTQSPKVELRHEHVELEHNGGDRDENLEGLSSEDAMRDKNTTGFVTTNEKPEVDYDSGSQSDAEHSATESMSRQKEEYESKLALALKKNVLTKAQLEAAQREKEELEKKLNLATRSQQATEAKLGAALKELEAVRKRLEASEIVQEESNSLSNIVHSENLRLEHDLSFLKAVLEETQKELHSTRGVLASERSRAFQLQVELFELKQKLQP